MTFVLMGRAFALYSILGHEAAHRLLFTKKAVNDVVGRWAVAYPAFVPLDVYRRSHFAHHKDEFGPNEPDLNLYNGYPIGRDSMRRKLIRDADGTSGWKNLKGLLFALQRHRPTRGAEDPRQPGGAGRAARHRRVEPVVALPAALAGAVDDGVAGAQPPALDRRARRHDALGRPAPHHPRRAPVVVARFWIVPFNTGWHLAHHADMGVPFQDLPRFHAELVDSGWVTVELEHPSYRSLWRALTAR